MKKTRFVRKISKDNTKYEIVKAIAYLQTRLSFGEKRKQKEFAYSIFEHDDYFDKNNNALPEQYYFKPTDIVIYDLLRKEDLTKVKRGFIKLYKKCYSHKFIGGSRSEEDIETIIQGLDQTLHSGNSWYKTSRFDFSYDDELDSYIHSFEISVHNFCSSYAAIEIRIELSDTFVNELSQFIKRPYKKPGMCIHQMWGRSKKKSGAKKAWAVSSGELSEYAKSRIVHEHLQYVKHMYLREIANYFPLMQYTKHKDIKSINVFETNLTPSSQLEPSIYRGLGLNEMRGFYFSSAERFYTSEEAMITRSTDEHDMMFVYNPDLITDYEMYYSPHNMVLEQLTLDYMNDLYRIVILNELGKYYRNLISTYRNKVNKCKNSRWQHKSLLKLQYQLNQDFYDFKKINEELPVDEEFENAAKILMSNEHAKSSTYYGTHTCKRFTDAPKWIWEQIRLNYTEVVSDLNRKLEISDSLSKYIGERKNRNMVFIQVVLAAATFFLLLFPAKAEAIASLIKRVWRYFSLLFQ